MLGQVRIRARRENLVLRRDAPVEKRMHLVDAQAAGIALVFDDVLRRALVVDGAAIGILDIEAIGIDEHGDDVEAPQMLEYRARLLHGNRLIEQELARGRVAYLRSVVGHEHPVVAIELELMSKCAQAVCRPAGCEDERDTRPRSGKQRLLCARRDALLVVGKRTVDIERDGFDGHGSLSFPFRICCREEERSPRVPPLKSGQELARDSTAFSMSASFPARFSKRARNETVPRAIRSAWDDPTRPRYRIPRRQRRQPRRARGQWPRRAPLPACKHRDILAETTR